MRFCHERSELVEVSMPVGQGGPKLTWSQLTKSASCNGDLCAVFKDRSPTTVSMSVLVVVEMFNALNALSENNSLLQVHPHTHH